MGIQRMISNLSWGLVLLTFATVSARADLIGQSVEIDYLYPTQADIYQVLGTGIVTGPGYTVNSFGQHNYTVTGSQITLLNVAGSEVSVLLPRHSTATDLLRQVDRRLPSQASQLTPRRT